VLVAEDGVPVTYNEQGESRPSACFGGAPKVVELLRMRKWRGSQEPRREPRVTLNWPRRVPELMLDRAAGCLFGLAIGGNLGPDTELAITVARSLVGHTRYDRATVETAIETWRREGGHLGRASSLARAAAIGIWASDPEAAVSAARLDQPGQPRHGFVAVAIAHAINGGASDDLRRMFGEFGDASLAMPEPSATHWQSAIAGALAGAVYGRGAFPVDQVMRVQTWRPEIGLGVTYPRPEVCWTDDLVDLAEALLCQGQRAEEPA